MQLKYNRNAYEIVKDLIWYKEKIEEMYADLDDRKKYFAHEKMPEYIYILPINFDYIKDASVIFDLDKEQERQKLIKIFKSDIKGVKVLSFDNMPLFKDGIHLNYVGHELLANNLEEVLNHE